VPGFAGEGEELLVPAIRALEASESGGEVAASVKLIDHGDGVFPQGAVGFAVAGFVVA
jgi:hypothetical protein